TGISALNPQEYVTPKMVQALCDKRKRTTSVATKVLSEESHDFDLLLRLDLLSHSASAWTDNGEELFLSGKVMFRELPASREDVFNLISRNLLNNGICDNGLAVYVMEHARKGSFGRQGMTAELEGLLLSLGAPRWYLDCLNKTKYLFPKAHGIAHLLIDVVDEWYRMNFSDIYEKICVEKSAD
ncbi:MAG: hypothetical protein IKV35_05105, partial [Clostridia bacterium]|nr:hypothetical protein [Clostridia bacterium]